MYLGIAGYISGTVVGSCQLISVLVPAVTEMGTFETEASVEDGGILF
jgi:hypothetical protein